MEKLKKGDKVRVNHPTLKKDGIVGKISNVLSGDGITAYSLGKDGIWDAKYVTKINEQIKPVKKRVDESAIMIASLLPVGRVNSLSMRGNKKDNFEFKGLPGQFDENGKKIYNEYGERINEDFDKKYQKKADDDFEEITDAKEMIRKVMVSSKKYSKSTYELAKKTYNMLDDLAEHLFADADLGSFGSGG